jgi:hypothetical protein
VPGRKHLGPDAVSRYPVGPPVKLQIPCEPPEADFTTKGVRHSIIDTMASTDTTEKDMDRALVTAVECSIESMTDLHSKSCCVCATASTSAYNVVSWEQIKMATREDGEMQDLM